MNKYKYLIPQTSICKQKFEITCTGLNIYREYYIDPRTIFDLNHLK